MTRWQLLALFLGVLLLAAPLSNVQGEEDEYEEDDGDAGEPSKAEDDGEPSEKDVVVLTAKNFEDKVMKSEFALVEFYAPWCGHCKKLKPEYAKAATQLKEYNPDIVIGKVDATVEKELAGKYEVKGYPTLKWFVNGKASEYGGGRDEDSLVRWVKKKTGPPAITIDTEDDLKSAETSNEALVLGYFAKFEGKEFEQFVAAARLAEDVTYAQTKEAAVAKVAGVKGDAPAVIIIKNFEDEDREVVALEGDITTDKLGEFAKSEKLPLVIPFGEKNQDKIFDSGIDRQCLVVADKKELTGDADLIKAVKAVAETHKGKMIFVSVDSSSESATPVINFFGLGADSLPQVVSFHLSGSKKYKMTGEITQESLQAFTNGVLDGTFEPDYKSEDIPAEGEDKAGGVQIVVGKTFDKIVKDPTKDVLLEVYAPWCGHCKSLEPIYKKLAKRFAKIDSVVIAKMDGTANEHKDVDVKGFPTLLFFPAQEGAESIPYESGDRTLLPLTKFIKKHAVIEYELAKKSESGDNKTEEKPADGHEEL